MAGNNSIARERDQTCPIPRYIQSLHNIAARAGLKASWRIGKDDDGEFIQSVWWGTRGRFRKTHLLTPSYHFPLMSGKVWTTYGLHGNMAKVENGLAKVENGYELVFDYPKPETIETLNGGMQILHYSSSNRYADVTTCVHGTIEDLKAAGLITDQDIPSRGHSRKDNSNSQTGSMRRTRRQPDGTLLFSFWTEQKSSRTEQQDGRDKRVDYQSLDHYCQHLAKNVSVARDTFSLSRSRGNESRANLHSRPRIERSD